MVIERAPFEQSIKSLLLQKRKVFLNGPITTESATSLIAEMLYLDSVNQDECIQMYINSSSGSWAAALGIYDTMNYIKTPVRTLVTGKANCTAALLLCAGEPGERTASPNSMISLNTGTGKGKVQQPIDMMIQAKLRERTMTTVLGIFKKHTDQPDSILEERMGRTWFSAKQAVRLGLADKVGAGPEPQSVN
jgi:ATP-dependent Clp protease, protease subunit